MSVSATPQVAVRGCGVFVPGFAGVKAWRTGKPKPGAQEPTAQALHPRQRRRTSVLTKALTDAYVEALNNSGFRGDTVASVFGSALGEAAIMIGLLDQMWGQEGLLSPMRFATSVHNAAAGVVSIAMANKNFSTSLGADYDTPAMALAEGMGLVVAEDCEVIVCCGDEMINKDLIPDGMRWELLAAAIAIAPVAKAPAKATRLSFVTQDASSIEAESLPTPLALNPNAGLLDLVNALESGKQGCLRLDRGKGQGYSLHITSP